jgi:hypothetical protein
MRRQKETDMLGLNGTIRVKIYEQARFFNFGKPAADLPAAQRRVTSR